jgi:alkylhydroperoxidase/carboxymuconolactone decarboxylase family protein YurZ
VVLGLCGVGPPANEPQAWASGAGLDPFGLEVVDVPAMSGIGHAAWAVERAAALLAAAWAAAGPAGRRGPEGLDVPEDRVIPRETAWRWPSRLVFCFHREEGGPMGYLPEVYRRFETAYPSVMDAFTRLAESLHDAGPLSPRERRLAKLGIAIGGKSEGAVRSHARKALAEGIETEAVRHVAVLAISTAGYPAAMAAFAWINEVLDATSP